MLLRGVSLEDDLGTCHETGQVKGSSSWNGNGVDGDGAARGLLRLGSSGISEDTSSPSIENLAESPVSIFPSVEPVRQSYLGGSSSDEGSASQDGHES